MKSGDTVTIYVSQGQDNSLVQVVDVRDRNASDATTILTNLGLVVYIKEVESAEVPQGLVISQDIEGGSSVETGTAVTLTVSTEVLSRILSLRGETFRCYPAGYFLRGVPGILEHQRLTGRAG